MAVLVDKDGEIEERLAAGVTEKGKKLTDKQRDKLKQDQADIEARLEQIDALLGSAWPDAAQKAIVVEAGRRAAGRRGGSGPGGRCPTCWGHGSAGPAKSSTP